ncbi:unnamed protein product [Gongylonema pulchrum]|uniref:AGC-kinase C-terminal domain-containing protein n=1 Tax=Gongylonema pulchrum TaxID=637853 RepID=A0A183F1B4_9BILA|nr:unnamed protein product [Gongylonema pulchrum]
MEHSYFSSRGIPPPSSGPVPLRGLDPTLEFRLRERYLGGFHSAADAMRHSFLASRGLPPPPSNRFVPLHAVHPSFRYSAIEMAENYFTSREIPLPNREPVRPREFDPTLYFGLSDW